MKSHLGRFIKRRNMYTNDPILKECYLQGYKDSLVISDYKITDPSIVLRTHFGSKREKKN
jgi:hypothetical protein